MPEWLHIGGAEEVKRTDAAVLLAHHGREEWFPLAHVVLLEDGWHVKRWLADSRKPKGRGDTSCMRPRKRRGDADLVFLFLLVIVAVAVMAAVEVRATTTLRIERRADSRQSAAQE